jgi:hypothetical protein
MRANRRTHRHVTFVIAIHRAFLPMQTHGFPFPVVHVVEGVRVGVRETVAYQVGRIIQILLYIPPETTVKRPPIYAE